MNNTPKRQGDKLVEILKKRGLTTLEMNQLGISVCPWKRVKEAMPAGWKLDKSERKGRHIVYRIVKG